MCPRIWDKDQEITVSLHKEPRGCMQQLRRRVTGDGGHPRLLRPHSVAGSQHVHAMRAVCRAAPPGGPSGG